MNLHILGVYSQSRPSQTGAIFTVLVIQQAIFPPLSSTFSSGYRFCSSTQKDGYPDSESMAIKVELHFISGLIAAAAAYPYDLEAKAAGHTCNTNAVYSITLGLDKYDLRGCTASSK
jgi:hypothetical protein